MNNLLKFAVCSSLLSMYITNIQSRKSIECLQLELLVMKFEENTFYDLIK